MLNVNKGCKTRQTIKFLQNFITSMLKTQNFMNFMLSLSLSLVLTLFLAPPWSSPSHVNVLLYVHRHVIVGQMIP